MMALARNVANIDLEQGDLLGWISGVVRHKAADAYRLAERRSQAAQAAAAETVFEKPDNVSQAIEGQETRAHVLGTLEKMSSDERLALEWKYVDDLSVAQIAARLGRTEKATESLLYRARQAFRSFYETKQTSLSSEETKS
jgi:RNA polymerase sigma-70 factor (ECF subfamily)